MEPEFKKRNGDYKAFMQKLWILKKHLGIDDRLKRLKDNASKLLVELDFNKREHPIVSDEIGKLLDNFYERHIKPIPSCFQIKDYSLIVDSAIAVILASFYPDDKCSELQADFRIKSLMKQFLWRRVVAQ